jgi:predicted membrane chloride channel (bestrophin family)
MKTLKKAYTLIDLAIVFCFFFKFALVVSLGYVAVHFITKFW